MRVQQKSAPNTQWEMPSGFEAGILGRRELAGLTHSDESELRHAERRAVAAHLDLPVERVAMLRQVHGSRCVCVNSDALVAGDRWFTEEADAMCTREVDLALCIRTADCVPIFLFSPHGGGLVGLIHAGWRGLAAGIIPQFFTFVRYQFGTPPGEITAVVGAAISGEVYEVGPETAQHFRRSEERGGRLFVDLQGEAIDQLEAAGAIARNAGGCTFLENTNYFSHRRGDTGRNLNFIRRKGAGTS